MAFLTTATIFSLASTMFSGYVAITRRARPAPYPKFAETATLDEYRGYKQVKCPSATGRFSLQQLSSEKNAGRMTLCTPKGNAFTPVMVNHVTRDDIKSSDAFKTAYGDDGVKWAADTVRLFDTLRVNMVGPRSDLATLRKATVERIPYMIVPEFVEPDNDRRYIKADYPDVFSEQFAKSSDAIAKYTERLYGKDPYLVTIGVCNNCNFDLQLPGGSANPSAVWWYKILGSSQKTVKTTPAREAWKTLYETRYASKGIVELNRVYGKSFVSFDDMLTIGSDLYAVFVDGVTAEEQERATVAYNDINAWNAEVAGKFHEVTYTALKKYFPSTLVSSDIHEQGLYTPEYFKAIASFSDITPIDGHATIGQGTPAASLVNQYAEQTGQPVFISGYTYAVAPCGETDDGADYPEADGAGTRANAQISYRNTVLQNPNVLGVGWDEYSDRPLTGNTDCTQVKVGIVDLGGSLYPEIGEAAKQPWSDTDTARWAGKPIAKLDTGRTPLDQTDPELEKELKKPILLTDKTTLPRVYPTQPKATPGELPTPDIIKNMFQAPKGGWLGTGDNFPKLGANIFFTLADNPACSEALGSYGGFLRGAIFSSSIGGGYRYDSLPGFGSYKDLTYDVGDYWMSDQVPVSNAKIENPNLEVFAHRSIAKTEAKNFGNKTKHPLKWFADSLSPRWYATTKTFKLLKPVSSPTEQEFVFSKEAIEEMISWDTEYFPNGPGHAAWNENNQFDWYYFQFIDNEANAGRGTVELMAIDHVELRANDAVVTVAKRDDTGERAIFGSSQSYGVDDRAGIVPHSSPGYGSLVFAMNRYCTVDKEQAGTCSQIRADGSSWLEAAAEYVGYFFMQAEYESIDLVNGVIGDADDENWQNNGFMLANRETYKLDQDFDGKIDDLTDVNAQLIKAYDEYGRLIKNDMAAKYGRPDFRIIYNGHLATNPETGELISHEYTNGRRFEDFDGNFEEAYDPALHQYSSIYNTEGVVAQPPAVFVAERDRVFNDQGKENYDEHRNIMAMTLVLGNGYYDHTYYHDTGIPVCSCQSRDDWFDEFSVDANGVSSKHPDYSAEVATYDNVCGQTITEKNRYQYVGWLGKPLAPGIELDQQGHPEVYRRDFENGVVLYSTSKKDEIIDLGGEYQKILGVDPDNQGALFNDGSFVTVVTIPKVTDAFKGRGVILRKKTQ